MLHPRPRLLPACIAAALLSGPAAAIGIGDIHLRSFLGAPLQAEVPLNHIDDLTADQLKVQIGSQSDYSALGVDYSYLHTQLKIEPIIKNGQGYVRITTREPISEPYLNFVLNLHWPKGQLVREFTVLLDPAPIATPTVAGANQPAAASEPRQLELPIADAVDPKPVRKSKARHPLNRIDRPAPTGAYMTRPGDSLWRVANKLRPAGVSTEQMMQALYAANPQAFVKGDTTRLKAVVPLTAPTAEQIAAAGGTAPAATAEPQTVASSSSSVATRSEETVSAGVEAAPGLQQENAVLKTQVSELTGNVATLNESLAQSEQRLHALESQLNDLLVQFQQQRATVAALSGTAAETRPTVNPAPANGSMISQVNAADLHPVPIARTSWWVHLLYLLGIGGMAMIAVREHFWPRRLAAAKIGVGDASMPLERTSIAAGHDWHSADKNAGYWHHSGSATSANPSVSDDMPEEIVAMPVAEEVPELPRGRDDPVDASISAGVFVAFGRFDEAERLLLQAIEHAPERTDLQLQLLDVYTQADRRDAFEALADDIERNATSPEVIAELAVVRENFANKH